MSGKQDYVTCPYNKSHQILKTRMARHLMKCRKQHPSSGFETCPFNTTHDVPVEELENHIMTCPDKKKVDDFLYVVGEAKPYEVPTNIELPAAEENWDEEEVQPYSYLDCKDIYLENKMVYRHPVGLTKSERKAFFKNEMLRMEKIRRKMKNENGDNLPCSSVHLSCDSSRECSTSSKSIQG